MHILVTNDDGVHAPGILALAQALREVGQVTILAPQSNQSAAGHSLTFHKPLRVTETQLADGTQALVCNGSPADCVNLAYLGVVEPEIDVVVSGINNTWNLGQDVTLSGTATAAMEGALLDLPSIAVSAYATSGQPRYDAAAAFAAQLTLQVARNGLPKHTLLNVNVPDVAHDKIAGMKITRQSTRIYRDKLVRREDPRGQPYYWIGGQEPTADADDEGTDFWALSNGYVSVTPLQMDMTAYSFVEQMQSWQIDLGPPLQP